jgi:hypothetical protein
MRIYPWELNVWDKIKLGRLVGGKTEKVGLVVWADSRGVITYIWRVCEHVSLARPSAKKEHTTHRRHYSKLSYDIAMDAKIYSHPVLIFERSKD